MKIRTLAAGLFAALLLGPATSYAGAPAPDLYGHEQYSDLLDYTVTWPPADPPRELGATGMPAGITFTDNGDNTGHLGGLTTVVPGVYNIDLTATSSGVTTHKTLALTVQRERAVVRLARTNSTSVSRTRSFLVKARVKDQNDGYSGDITRAEPGAFQLDRNGHVTACLATMVPGSLYTGKGPDHYDVKCRVPAGLHRGLYQLTYSVAGDYYQGTNAGSLRITR